MVPLNFSSFMLAMVLLFFLTEKSSIAHSDDQARQTLLVHEAENGYSVALIMEKDVLDDVQEVVEGKMGGRKMLIETKNVKEKMKEVEVTEEADSKNSSGAASASTHSIGKLKYHKGRWKLKELSGISNNSHSMKANTRSFVALNADYHMARPHPPKNN